MDNLTLLEKEQKRIVLRSRYYKKWYAKNKHKNIKRAREWYLNNIEKAKQYQRDHKERIHEQCVARKLASGWKPKTDFLYNQKRCRECKRENIPLMKSCKSHNGEHQYWMCRKCNTRRGKNYRKTETGMANVKKAAYKSMKKYSKEQNARVLLNYHVRKGNITKPEKCEVCKKHKKVHAHHDDYNFPLKVHWVCRPCHADIHRKLNGKL